MHPTHGMLAADRASSTPRAFCHVSAAALASTRPRIPTATAARNRRSASATLSTSSRSSSRATRGPARSTTTSACIILRRLSTRTSASRKRARGGHAWYRTTRGVRRGTAWSANCGGGAVSSVDPHDRAICTRRISHSRTRSTSSGPSLQAVAAAAAAAGTHAGLEATPSPPSRPAPPPTSPATASVAEGRRRMRARVLRGGTRRMRLRGAWSPHASRWESGHMGREGISLC